MGRLGIPAPLGRGGCQSDQTEDNYSVEKFLDFLEKDLSSRPQALQFLTADFVDQIQMLEKDVQIDLDAPLLNDTIASEFREPG
ncbi:type II toxin-antitoxin system PrlF family antitoxin [Spirulina major CS-329]|uniref:type II toxin-antitoxin system PrlF family antitoxin n=1 Tax=Spirulina TaxID=1154 RepID=UPI00232E583C|nr:MULTISPECIES: type II toxin-antitoxin system PrlF family antitoxin [Spirulina]MDB9495351.1 type II toxin-antitoxin system PrlF family antitoxin [Spirulina subsalsa CS-330]MDB9505000.1 type II toxin-antitoxin system PrlF family antitoxin [Spirulina major CS-329]